MTVFINIVKCNPDFCKPCDNSNSKVPQFPSSELKPVLFMEFLKLPSFSNFQNFHFSWRFRKPGFHRNIKYN